MSCSTGAGSLALISPQSVDQRKSRLVDPHDALHHALVDSEIRVVRIVERGRDLVDVGSGVGRIAVDGASHGMEVVAGDAG